METVIQALCHLDEETKLPELRKARGKTEYTMEAYETLRTLLNDEQKKWLDAAVREMQNAHLDELDLYYELGFQTGFSLAKEIK